MARQANALVTLILVPFALGLLALDRTSGRIDLIAGRNKDGSPTHYAIITDSETGAETPVNFHDAVGLGFETGDAVEVELAPDTTDAPAPFVHGFPNVRPLRITRVIKHAHSQKELKVATSGTRSALAIRMSYTDAPESQCNAACITANLYTSPLSTQAMYFENSYGTLSFDSSTTATKPRVVAVTIARSIGDPCGTTQSTLNQISSEANAAVTAQLGISLSQYDLIIHYTPAMCGIGVAFVGEFRSFINDGAPDTVAHEVGHNFGAGHASLDTANFPKNFEVQFSQANDVVLEYGDVSSVMGIGGFGIRGFAGPHRLALGWITSTAVFAPSLTACPIAVSLRSLAITPDSTGVSIVRIPKASGGNYIISFRTASGQDVNMKYASEVGIHSHAGGSEPTFLWKYVAVGETETTSDGLVVSFVSVQGTTAQITLAQNGVGQACTTISPSPSQASFSRTPSNTPTKSPTPSPRGTIQCGQSVSGTNVGAPNEFDVRPPNGSNGPDVGLIFSINAATTVTFSTCGQASFDTMLGLFGPDRTTSLGFNDDGSNGAAQCAGFTSLLTVTNLAAGSYFIVVDGFGGVTGTFTLSVTCANSGTTSTSTPTTSRAVAASATGTPSRTASPTISATSSRSRTVAPSGTPTPSASASNSRAPSATASRSPSQSPTKSSSRAPAPSLTPTHTRAPTVSRTRSITRSRSRSRTRTRSRTR